VAMVAKGYVQGRRKRNGSNGLNRKTRKGVWPFPRLSLWAAGVRRPRFFAVHPYLAPASFAGSALTK